MADVSATDSATESATGRVEEAPSGPRDAVTVLEVDGLVKRYGSKVAVDRVSFEIRRGEIFGLLGPNGAGKSTTLAVAVGLLSADEGRVSVLDARTGARQDPRRSTTRRRIGMAPQSLALYDELSAQENLRFFARVQGVPKAEVGHRVEWALEFAGLVDVRFDRVSTYSGGMKRRLNLAAAVIHEPELVLLDEPTVGVDPQSRNSIFERVEALRDRGSTIVYTTHYMEEAERLCDRIAIIDRGRLIGLDDLEGLLRAHGGPGLLTVEHDGGREEIETDEPLRVLQGFGGDRRVRTFRYQPPNLEDVFLRLTGRELRD